MRITVNQLRNERLSKGQYTDAADDMLLKLFLNLNKKAHCKSILQCAFWCARRDSPSRALECSNHPLLLLHKINPCKTKRAAPHKVLLLVRPGGFEPLAFRVGELRHGSIDWR